MTNWITEGVWQTIWGFGYFTASYTSIRNLNELGAEYDEQKIDALRRAGPVSPLSKKVVLSTLIVSLPFCLNGVLNYEAYSYSIYLAIWWFFSPLIFQSRLAPGQSDLKHPFWYTFKWIYSKLDLGIKLALLTGIGALLSLVPFIGKLGLLVAEFMLPVLSNKQGSAFFESLVSGMMLAFLVTHLIKMLLLMVNGIRWCVVYCISAACLWIHFQWLLDEVVGENIVHPMLHISFFGAIILDYLHDILTIHVER